MPISIEGDYMTVGEAARLLQVGQSAVSHAIAAGRLKAEKVGPRGTLIERAELERYKVERANRGWDKRRAGEAPSAAALRMREMRARRKQQSQQETATRAEGERNGDHDGRQDDD